LAQNGITGGFLRVESAGGKKEWFHLMEAAGVRSKGKRKGEKFCRNRLGV